MEGHLTKWGATERGATERGTGRTSGQVRDSLGEKSDEVLLQKATIIIPLLSKPRTTQDSSLSFPHHAGSQRH